MTCVGNFGLHIKSLQLPSRSVNKQRGVLGSFGWLSMA